MRKAVLIGAIAMLIATLIGINIGGSESTASENSCDAAYAWVVTWQEDAEKAGINDLDPMKEGHTTLMLLWTIDYLEKHEAPELLEDYNATLIDMAKAFIGFESVEEMVVSVDEILADVETEKSKIVQTCGADHPIVTDYLNS